MTITAKYLNLVEKLERVTQEREEILNKIDDSNSESEFNQLIEELDAKDDVLLDIHETILNIAKPLIKKNTGISESELDDMYIFDSDRLINLCVNLIKVYANNAS